MGRGRGICSLCLCTALHSPAHTWNLRNGCLYYTPGLSETDVKALCTPQVTLAPAKPPPPPTLAPAPLAPTPQVTLEPVSIQLVAPSALQFHSDLQDLVAKGERRCGKV